MNSTYFEWEYYGLNTSSHHLGIVYIQCWDHGHVFYNHIEDDLVKKRYHSLIVNSCIGLSIKKNLFPVQWVVKIKVTLPAGIVFPP